MLVNAEELHIEYVIWIIVYQKKFLWFSTIDLTMIITLPQNSSQKSLKENLIVYEKLMKNTKPFQKRFDKNLQKRFANT